jgi:hypothetical protein
LCRFEGMQGKAAFLDGRPAARRKKPIVLQPPHAAAP